MSDAIWIGGVGLALFLATLSMLVRRRWFLLYLATLFVGSSAGLLLWSWPELMRTVWWGILITYGLLFPIWRISVYAPRGPADYNAS